MGKIKVLIVDDSAIARKVISNALESDSEIEVVGTAPDAFVARNKVLELNPDVISLDVQMPRMDGVTFLQKLMKHHPIPVVMVSALTQKGAEVTMQALEAGAVDVVAKPVMDQANRLNEITIELIDKIKSAARAKVKVPLKSSVLASMRQPIKPMTVTSNKVIAIGASTGGTEALKNVLSRMPVNSPGILVVQHMPETFTTAFAERLNALCAIKVKEAEHGDYLDQGLCLLAPGNLHMLLRRSGQRYKVEVKDGPLVSRHRPSVEVLFNSVANAAGKNAVGVIMTGMGADGAKGMLNMKNEGATTIAQDEKTCVIFGMPKAAIKMGGVDKITSLHKIPEIIIESV